jgi:uncharacterized membrane protein YqhA
MTWNNRHARRRPTGLVNGFWRPGAADMLRLNRWFSRVVLARAWLTFVVMCSAFGLFGAGTLNIFSMFSTNWDMITQLGLMALASGSLLQLLELLGTLTLAMFFYTIFKACEHSLVQRITHPHDKAAHE